MEKKTLHFGEGELIIMQVLWRAGEALTTAAINRAVEERGWKRTTVSTFLTRLVEKGAITAEKRGTQYVYTPAVAEETYRRARTGHLVDSLFGGSVTALAASLFEDTALSEADVQELRRIIEGRTK